MMSGVKNGAKYMVDTSNSKYLSDKYGATPVILIDGTDEEVFGGSWKFQNGNPACMCYGMRSGVEKHPWDGKVYYGKIGGLGELVHESELIGEVENE